MARFTWGAYSASTFEWNASGHSGVAGRMGKPEIRTTGELVEELAKQFAEAMRASDVAARIASFKRLPTPQQERAISGLYASVERALPADGDGAGKRSELRHWVRTEAAALLDSSSGLRVAVESEAGQGRLLSQALLLGALRRALSELDESEGRLLQSLVRWVEGIPEPRGEFFPLGMSDPLPVTDDGWIAYLRKLTERLHAFLKDLLGPTHAEEVVLGSLEELTELHAELPGFGAVLAQLPTEVLNERTLAKARPEHLIRALELKAREAEGVRRGLTEQGDELERVRRDLRRARATVADAVREFKTVLDGVGEAIILTDATGTIVMANREAERLWGSADEVLFGVKLQSLLTEADEGGRRSPSLRWQSLPELVGQSVALRGRRPDGTSFPLALRVSQTTSGDLVRFTVAVRDLTEQRRTEDALRQSHERFILAVQGASHGLWDWDLVTNRMHYSEQWCEMLGLSHDQLAESPDTWFSRIHPDERERVQGELRSHLEGRTPQFEYEHRMRHADGTYRWILSRARAIFGDKGKPLRIAGSHVDLTERKVTDPLTGLANRVLLLDRLGRAMERHKREPGYEFAVLFIDLDGFKVVNDSLGHLVGDQLLLAIAQRLEACIRSEDMVARMGGDEFTILLDAIVDVGDAKRVADRIQKELKAPFYLKRQEVFTSASIGIALGSGEYERPDDLLRDADTAMYRAKALGKARYEVFDLAMRDRAVALMQLHTDLRRAVEKEEFELHYQPIVALSSGETRAFEALVRWSHPERGLVPPSEFIPAAEETGLIVPLGRWVIREACRQLRRWRDEERDLTDVSVSINISRRQFAARDLAATIQKALHESDIEPWRLKLEITESLIMEDEEYVAEQLQRLRELDIQICIDDFGTGYSSLSALHRFPIDMLKIDHSFVSRIEGDRENLEIIRTIITLAHTLNMSVVAEGVERSAQLRTLRELGCDYWQGYYCTRPVRGELAAEYLVGGSRAMSHEWVSVKESAESAQ